MVDHGLSILWRAFVDMPSRVGSNWGGVLFSVCLFGIGQVLVLITIGGWAAWKQHWVRNAVGGFVTVAVGWLGLFAISLIANVYDDHQNLAGAIRRLKREVKEEGLKASNIFAEKRMA